MDQAEFLLNVIRNDEEGLYPSAERLYRELYVSREKWHYPSTKGGYDRAKPPQISDPEGLIRSIRSKRYGNVAGRYKREPRFIH